MKKDNINIGFDFDKVFVSYPPIIPSFLIDWLYKGNYFFSKPNNDILFYRYPGKIERQIRVVSHTPLLRRPIKRNISALQKLSENKKYNIYLISSRFSFLADRTHEWIKRNKIGMYFKEMYFNFKNEQPHEFKNSILKKLKINYFIDDDLDLLIFLATENSKIKFYWLSSNKPYRKIPSNIKTIKSVKDFKI